MAKQLTKASSPATGGEANVKVTNTTQLGAPFDFAIELPSPREFFVQLNNHNEPLPPADRVGFITGAIRKFAREYPAFARGLQFIADTKADFLAKLRAINPGGIIAQATTEIGEIDQQLEDDVKEVFEQHGEEKELHAQNREGKEEAEQEATGTFLDYLARLTGQNEDTKVSFLPGHLLWSAAGIVFIVTLLIETLGGFDLFNTILGQNAALAAVLLLSIGVNFVTLMFVKYLKLWVSHSAAQRAFEDNFPQGIEMNGETFDRVFSLDPKVKTYVKACAAILCLILVPIVAMRGAVVYYRLEGEWMHMSSTLFYLMAIALGGLAEFFVAHPFAESFLQQYKALKSDSLKAKKELDAIEDKTEEKWEEELSAKLKTLAVQYSEKIQNLHARLLKPLTDLAAQKLSLLTATDKASLSFTEVFELGLLGYVSSLIDYYQIDLKLKFDKPIPAREVILAQFGTELKRNDSLYSQDDLRVPIPEVELPRGMDDPESRINEIRAQLEAEAERDESVPTHHSFF